MAQTPDLKSMSDYPKMVQAQVTTWIERAAEKMPEEEYAFKPDPGSRSFGQILGHIADAY
jgi:DinB superfamily